ncbi:hypothetical protein BWP39_20980 [Paraburkholderia acidicola]|uniref:Uncharacterized protein n=1 Tax=Paraburkholderia acidicola TaxID=1912599 RepID=A0A2A4EP08_9BURK|nr:hypothetical protein BWP39_20980 [Paraburkholderia acidicola]
MAGTLAAPDEAGPADSVCRTAAALLASAESVRILRRLLNGFSNIAFPFLVHRMRGCRHWPWYEPAAAGTYNKTIKLVTAFTRHVFLCARDLLSDFAERAIDTNRSTSGF